MFQLTIDLIFIHCITKPLTNGKNNNMKKFVVQPTIVIIVIIVVALGWVYLPSSTLRSTQLKHAEDAVTLIPKLYQTVPNSMYLNNDKCPVSPQTPAKFVGQGNRWVLAVRDDDPNLVRCTFHYKQQSKKQCINRALTFKNGTVIKEAVHNYANITHTSVNPVLDGNSVYDYKSATYVYELGDVEENEVIENLKGACNDHENDVYITLLVAG